MQINNAAWRIEQPWVGIPLIHGRGKLSVRSGKPLDGRHHLCASLGRNFPAKAAHPIKRM
jgi:hypothetical protein